MVDSGANKLAYAKVEASYGTIPTPTSTDAIRVVKMSLDKKLNRVPSPHKRLTPDVAQSLARRISAGGKIDEAMWEPSGTLGTPSYWDALFTHFLGTRHALSLATTVAASPTPTATGCTLTSATGVAVGDIIVFTVASGARREVTRVKSVVSAAITYDALSVAPDSLGAAVVGATWAPATALPASLALFLYHTDTSIHEAVTGWVGQSLDFEFDGEKEVAIKVAGIGKDRTMSPPSLPAAHTTVGAPSSGLSGTLYRGTSPFLVTSAKIRFASGLGLRNKDLFTSTASGIVREAKRKVEVEASFYVEDTTLLGDAEAVTRGALRLLSGTANGSMAAVVLPSVEWETYELPDTDGPTTATAKGYAYATSGNDDIFIGEA